MINDLIQELQDDVWGVLSSDCGFYHVPVFRARSPLDRDADGEPVPGRSMVIEDDIDAVLASMKPKNGRGGIAAIVLLPDVRPVSQNSVGPSMVLMQKVRILEDRMNNEGRRGTGISASRLALHTVQILNRRLLRGETLLIPHAQKMIEEVSLPDHVMATEVNMECAQGVDPAPQAQLSKPVSAEGRIVLSSTTHGADIYFTLDGSWPLPESARRYDEPLALPVGTHILRAVAVAAGMAPSNDVWSELTIS